LRRNQSPQQFILHHAPFALDGGDGGSNGREHALDDGLADAGAHQRAAQVGSGDGPGRASRSGERGGEVVTVLNCVAAMSVLLVSVRTDSNMRGPREASREV
jgi:hypothetical protein